MLMVVALASVELLNQAMVQVVLNLAATTVVTTLNGATSGDTL